MKRKRKSVRKKSRSLPRILLVIVILAGAFWYKEQGGTGAFPSPTRSDKTTQKSSTISGNSGPKGDAIRPVKGDVLEGKAVHIPDGDTFDLLTDEKKKFRVRMSGIDAPEKAQDYGQVSKEGLGSLLEGSRLKVVVRDVDRYGRSVCDVYTLKASGEDWVNLQMVQNGWAWHYKQYSKDPQLAAAEQTARAEKKGLWIQPAPTPPWEFRASKRPKSGF